MSKDASGGYHHRLHAIDIATGAEEFNGPVDVHATYPGSGDGSANGVVAFDAKQYKSRPGLLLVNGAVYTSWGSHCDSRPYTGWVIGYNGATLAQTSVFNFAPNGEGAAVWGMAQRGISERERARTAMFTSSIATTWNSLGAGGRQPGGAARVRCERSCARTL